MNQENIPSTIQAFSSHSNGQELKVEESARYQRSFDVNRQNFNDFNHGSFDQINQLFLRVCKAAETEAYNHSQPIYQQAHKVIKFIQQNSALTLNQQEQITLVVGKTGWGKSTIINILDGVQFRVDENGKLYPIDNQKLKTAIGNGNGSTTFAPVYANTRFGKVCDLPGEGQTRGIVPQIINGISKKNLSKSQKKIKLIIVVPASNLSSQGSYGRQFKNFLSSADKFLGDLNKYRQNIMLIVNFAQRFSRSYQKTKENLISCLNHEDGELNPYKQLINYLINRDRIKLITKPSQQSQDYNLPTNTTQWKQQSIEKIVKQIIQLPSSKCQQTDFSVPYNINMFENLILFLKVLVQKVKHQLQISLRSVKISGIQLTFTKKMLQQLLKAKNLTLNQFISIFKQATYFDASPIQAVASQINFILQFLQTKQQKYQEYRDNWVSAGLQANIISLLAHIELLLQEQKLNFRKSAKLQNLIVEPNSQSFQFIEKGVMQLQELILRLELAQQESKDENSQLFQTKVEKVFDGVISEPYEDQEKYVVEELQPKLCKTIKQKEEWVDVLKKRQSLRQQIIEYQEDVKKFRKVPKEQTVVQQYRGRRRYFGVAGPRQKKKVTSTRIVQVDEEYFEKEIKTKKVQKPFIQDYYEKQRKISLEEVQQWNMQPTIVEKIKKTTKYRQITLFKNKVKRVLNEEKYKQVVNNIAQQIQTKVDELNRNILGEISGVQLPFTLQFSDECCRSKIQKKYPYLFQSWYFLEHKKMAQKYPYRYSLIGRKIDAAD